jgi:hypothetical protein
MVTIKKIPGGYNVDGLELKNGKCGCTSVVKCCYSWSKVKVKESNYVEFQASFVSNLFVGQFHLFKMTDDTLNFVMSGFPDKFKMVTL